MNDDLNKALIAILQKATSGVEQGVSFLSAQMPDIVHQLVMYKIVSYSLQIVVFAILVVAIIMLSIRWHLYLQNNIRLDKDKDYFKRGDWGLGYLLLVPAGMGLLFFGAGLFAQSDHLIELLVAPKIWLIEYTADLIKQVH